MKKIFLVDDDAVVRALYQRQLERGGFEVCLAQDGLQAIQWLTTFTPDLVLLDLMMPRLAGDTVLRFIRSQPRLARLPVVVLTNAFMSDQARAVSDLGVARAIVKADCTPAKMLELVRQLLGVTPPLADAPTAAAPRRPIETPDAPRAEFLANAGIQIADLRVLSQEFKSSPEAAAESGNLAELYGQTHLLAAAAGLADCRHLALLGGALEALLFELVENPQFINASIARTVVAAVECLARLRADTQTVGRAETLSGQVLIVDDDALANRVALAALSRAKLNARAAENPLLALDLLTQNQFDLFLLDIEMPQLNGYELCRKIRCLPGYEKTPVIYVTGHTDYESRVKSILAGGDDLIAKPIFAIELAVKAVMHLLAGRLAAVGPAAR